MLERFRMCGWVEGMRDNSTTSPEHEYTDTTTRASVWYNSTTNPTGVRLLQCEVPFNKCLIFSDQLHTKRHSQVKHKREIRKENA